MDKLAVVDDPLPSPSWFNGLYWVHYEAPLASEPLINALSIPTSFHPDVPA